MQCRRKLFLIGGAENEGRKPEEIFKFIVPEMPFPGLWESFDRILMVSVLVCRNLQFVYNLVVLNERRRI